MASKTQKDINRQHADGYEHAMQFRGADVAWIAEQIAGVTQALREYPALASGDIEPRQGYFAGLIDGYSTLLSETVKGL